MESIKYDTNDTQIYLKFGKNEIINMENIQDNDLLPQDINEIIKNSQSTVITGNPINYDHVSERIIKSQFIQTPIIHKQIQDIPIIRQIKPIHTQLILNNIPKEVKNELKKQIIQEAIDQKNHIPTYEPYYTSDSKNIGIKITKKNNSNYIDDIVPEFNQSSTIYQ